jgi:hypothetical protein
MSKRYAGSLLLSGIHYLFRAQDFVAPKGVANHIFFHQIDFQAENFGKLIQHMHPIIESDAPSRFKGHQYIHIAVRAEILPQDRAEQRKLFRFSSAGRNL